MHRGRSTGRASRPGKAFAIEEQPSIGSHHGTAKLEHPAAIKTEPKHPIPVYRGGSTSPPRAIEDKLLIAIAESHKSRRNSVRYPVNAGFNGLMPLLFAHEQGSSSSKQEGI
jgi:hypothetical protein